VTAAALTEEISNLSTRIEREDVIGHFWKHLAAPAPCLGMGRARQENVPRCKFGQLSKRGSSAAMLAEPAPTIVFRCFKANLRARLNHWIGWCVAANVNRSQLIGHDAYLPSFHRRVTNS
jgi:hypothetical protein